MSSYNALSIDENSTRPKPCLAKNAIKVSITFIGIFFLTTVVFGFLWEFGYSPPFSSNKYALNNEAIAFPPFLSNDGKYLQCTILQLNNVYGMFPLDQQRKGSLARGRQLLSEENPHTFTILAGDFLSPSALSQAKVNGKQITCSILYIKTRFCYFW